MVHAAKAVLDAWGCSEVVLRTDQEPAILALTEEIRQLRAEREKKERRLKETEERQQATRVQQTRFGQARQGHHYSRRVGDALSSHAKHAGMPSQGRATA